MGSYTVMAHNVSTAFILKSSLAAKPLSSIVQMTAGLLVCCAPSLAVLFKRIKDPFRFFVSLSNHPLLLKALSFRSWGSRSTSSNTKSEKVGQRELERLPSIDQRATITGIRSFIDQQ